MNTKDKKLLSEFPSDLDEVVNAKFGKSIKCTTGFSIIEMRHVTTWKASKRSPEIRAFIDGFLAGHQSLVAALQKQ